MYPIILAHGVARFDVLREIILDKLGIAEEKRKDNYHYFRGIKTHLQDNGFEVYHSNVDFAGDVSVRARDLRKNIRKVLRKTGAGKVHIIAHSMGGLDARHMIVDFDMADKVASLTTIGTPHLGTCIADLAIRFGGRIVIFFLKFVVDLEGIKDLRTSACRRFNLRARDKEASNSVVYQAYASHKGRGMVFFLLLPTWFIIDRQEGKNDGLVSVKSQLWKKEIAASNGARKKIKQVFFPVQADHLNQIGIWFPPVTKPLMLVVNARRRKQEYEDKIKKIYLDMANDLVDLQ
jgi:triacylglycerol lipase